MARPKLYGFTEPATGLRKDAESDPNAVIHNITAAGAINPFANRVRLTGPATSTYAVTLAAPIDDQFGQLMSIRMIATTASDAVTLALTNAVGGTAATTASFDAVDEELILIAGIGRWIVLKQIGVTLS